MKTYTCLLLLALLFGLSVRAKVCPQTPDGQHYSLYYTSPVHTSSGHSCYKECLECGTIVHEFYRPLPGCCLCFGNHSLSLHISPIHTSSGHENYHICHSCGTRETLRYSFIDPCCLCGNHTLTDLGSQSSGHGYQGHLQERHCVDCRAVEVRNIQSFQRQLHSGEPTNSGEFLQWLMNRGIPATSFSGRYVAHYGTYAAYGLIVYGTPEQVPGNEFRAGQYRYLGYTYLEELFTNMQFPNDAESGIHPEAWIFLPVPGALESWERLEGTVQKPYMLHTLLVGHGATSLTAGKIGMANARIQAAACWSGMGSIRTNKPGGYYATFLVPSMGMGTLEATMLADPLTVLFHDGTLQETAVLSLMGSVNKPAREIRFMSVIFEGEVANSVNTLSGTNTVSRQQTVAMSRPGRFPEERLFYGTVEVFSIFGDRLIRELYCRILLSEVQGSGEEIPPSILPPPIVEEPAILSVKIVGSVNHWVGRTGNNENPLSDMPHRFLSLERIRVNVSVSAGTDRVVLRFCPELEAMQYTNRKGHLYDYALDFFGYYVLFPADSTLYVTGEGNAVLTWEYYLPICPPTMTWNNTRMRMPYTLTVIAYGNGKSVSHIIRDIDITGNLYDLLYPQPVP